MTCCTQSTSTATSATDYLPNGATGKILYQLIVKGRAAHANRPQEGGINAVTDASRIVASLDRLTLRDHAAFGRGTVCVLKIEVATKNTPWSFPSTAKL